VRPPHLTIQLLSHLAIADGNNLKGSFPEDFCLLTDLKKIVVGSNQNLKMPSCLGQLLNLEELNWAGDNLSGGLPNNLHGLPRLTKLDLSHNQITGPIDAMFPDSDNNQLVFPSLVALLLDDNNLSGEVPENKLRLLQSLSTLSISQNPELTGSLDEMCKGGGFDYAAADCSNVGCRCCAGGSGCPSSTSGST
jgi:LRR receptor-like serine/threonine-protein kinase FLS2